LLALESNDVKTNYEYVYGQGTFFGKIENPDSGDYILNIISGRKNPNPNISVVYGQADIFNKNKGKYKIGYTMLEVDGFNEEWVRQCNGMNEVWTPSEFNKQGMIKSGVSKPIYVMPLGVNTDYFNPNIKRVENPNGDYVFLSVFEFSERKNAKMLLKTFNDTFKSTDKVALICKIININSIDVNKQISEMNLNATGGRIYFIYNTDISYYQLGTLYTSSDCYVSCSKGEGWNMPLMEAMACGLPSIATDWGSHTQFINNKNSYPLKIKGLELVTRNHPYYYDGFYWSNPDECHLAKLMRHVFENQEEARKIGLNASNDMSENWTWVHSAERIETRITKILGDIKKQKPTVKTVNKNVAFTIVSNNYISYARTLCDSYLEHNPNGTMFVLLVDKNNSYFDEYSEKFILIESDQIGIPNFEEFSLKYSIMELNTAVKPFFIEYLYKNYDIRKIIYFDPDILILDNSEPIFKMLDTHNIVVIPHLTKPIPDDGKKPDENMIILAGAYNLGFIALGNYEKIKDFIDWWKDRLYKYGINDVHNGYFVDQKWIDLVVGFRDDIFILREPQYNVAYWNLHERNITHDGERFLSNGIPISFYHFSGIDPQLKVLTVSRHQNRLTLTDFPHLHKLYEHYKQKLYASGYNETRNIPYFYSNHEGRLLSDSERRVYYRSITPNYHPRYV